jgi:hypothetical protein
MIPFPSTRRLMPVHPPGRKIVLPVFPGFGVDALPQCVGLGNRHGQHEKKHDDEATEYSFAKIHLHTTSCSTVLQYHQPLRKTLRWTYFVFKLLPEIFEPDQICKDLFHPERTDQGRNVKNPIETVSQARKSENSRALIARRGNFLI